MSPASCVQELCRCCVCAAWCMGALMTSLVARDRCGTLQRRAAVPAEGVVHGACVVLYAPVLSRQQGAPVGFSCEGGLFEDEAVALLRDFYESGNPIGALMMRHSRVYSRVFTVSPQPLDPTGQCQKRERVLTNVSHNISPCTLCIITIVKHVHTFRLDSACPCLTLIVCRHILFGSVSPQHVILLAPKFRVHL